MPTVPVWPSCLLLALGVLFFAMAFAGGGAPASGVAVIGGITGLLVVRIFRIGLARQGDELIIRNIVRSHRIPLTSVEAFEVKWSRFHGGPVLCVRASGGRVPVTSFPITNLRTVAEKRNDVVAQLNRWLKAQA